MGHSMYTYMVVTCVLQHTCIRIYSGECMASMFGHSEIVTGVKFMNDLRHVISVSGDGCIFIWKLPLEFTEHMRSRLSALGKTTPKFEDDVNMNKNNQNR